MTTTTTTTVPTRPLLLAATLLLSACPSSGQPEQAKTDAPKPEAEAEPKPEAEAEAEAKPAQPEPEAQPEGYVAHLGDALAALASKTAIASASPPAYGCSVKYADEGAAASAKLGEPAPGFSLPDLDGGTVSLADFAGKTVVLEWFNPDCPFVKYAHAEGPLATMAATQAQADVVWLAINSGAPGKQGHGVERNREAKTEWKLEHPILLDEDGAVGHAYGATSTPHMFVVDPTGTLVYAGGLDNAPLGRTAE
jgi:peroxiredoxin